MKYQQNDAHMKVNFVKEVFGDVLQYCIEDQNKGSHESLNAFGWVT